MWFSLFLFIILRDLEYYEVRSKPRFLALLQCLALLLSKNKLKHCLSKKYGYSHQTEDFIAFQISNLYFNWAKGKLSNSSIGTMINCHINQITKMRQSKIVFSWISTYVVVQFSNHFLIYSVITVPVLGKNYNSERIALLPYWKNIFCKLKQLFW